MNNKGFNQSVENFFFERLDQLNPRKVSKEYFYLSEKHYSMFNELKNNIPKELQRFLGELSDLEVEMEALHLNLIYEQAFLDGAKLMRYLLQIGENRVVGSNRNSCLTEEHE